MNKFFSHKYFQKIKSFSRAHKIISTIIILVILGLLYYGYKNLTSTSGITTYTIASVEKGTLVVSVTGSGQVSSANQVDLKAKSSGDITYLGVEDSEIVNAGKLIAIVDTSNAQETVDNAQISLDQAKLDLQKLEGLTTTDGTIRGTKQKNADNLALSYETGLNNVVNIFLELPGIMSGLQDTLYSNSISSTVGGSGQNINYYADSTKTYDPRATQFKDDIDTTYTKARTAYNKNLSDYKSVSRFSDSKTLEDLINETYATVKLVAETVKNSNNLIQLYKDTLTTNGLRTISLADTHLATLNTYTGKTNSELSTLLSTINDIQTGKESSVSANFDISDQKIKVTQAENVLENAKKTLADCYIYAPFYGTVAKVNVEKGNSVSNGTSIATFISNQKIATLSLNEVDAAKVKVGQKATFTFDAIDGLTVVGQVSEVDTLGTVSQGVVTYSVKIALNTDDSRIKSGMSVSASIITDVKQDVLIIPNSAIKTQGTESYVEMFEQPISTSTLSSNNNAITSTISPVKLSIKTGLSNDSYTEITSGLNEGDQIISKTTTGTAATTKTTTNILSSLTGGNRNRTINTASSGSSANKTTSTANSFPAGGPPAF